MVAVVQLVRASDCGSECRGFESHLPPIRSSSSELLFLFPPISQARSRAHPTHSQAHPTHSRAHPAHCRTSSRAQPSPSRAQPSPSRLHPSPYSAPPPSSPQDAEAPPRLEHIPAKLEGTLAKLKGVPAKLEGTSTQLLTTSGDAYRTIRAFVSSETRIRTVRYVHPRRQIRASNDGHHTAEHTHNQCLADR